ncbi:MAG: hypothetical protein KKA76_10105 [Proteobacteria bacterium]|nr:hypothetical protein [Pseudomonadota bacterium]
MDSINISMVAALVKPSSMVMERMPLPVFDRGYRGKQKVGDTTVLMPKASGKNATAYQRQKMRKRFRRRAGIEPIIGHLKHDYRLVRNYLKGSIGDSINLLLLTSKSG